MAILTDSGRVAIARAIQNEALYLAWGVGDPAWDTTQEIEPITATQLVSEIGRRRASVVGYCLPDSQGDIITREGGRYRQTQVPSKYLFMRFAFDFQDGGDAMIRELGVFMHTRVHDALPPGQMYFTPEQIVDPGTLLLLERIPRTPRTPSQRTTYETVLTLWDRTPRPWPSRPLSTTTTDLTRSSATNSTCSAPAM